MYWENPDSIIADSLFNPHEPCPNLTAIYADSATNTAGSTYITFIGPGGVQDTTRKWGQYDSEMPVYALGTQLQGRATTDSTNGSYVLRIRNADVGGGIEVGLNAGEVVNLIDVNFVHAHNHWTGGTYDYFADFDESGYVDAIDEHYVQGHNTGKCHEGN